MQAFVQFFLLLRIRGRSYGLNGSIQELKTIGRGYRKTQNFRIAILFFHGDLDTIPHKKE